MNDGERLDWRIGVKLTFALKYDDLTEAIQKHQVAEKEVPLLSPGTMLAPNAAGVIKAAEPPGKKKFSASFLGWVMILMMAVGIFIVFHQEKKPAAGAAGGGVAVVPPVPETSLFMTMLINILPYVLIFVVIWFFFLRQLWGSRKKYDNDPFHLQERTVELLATGIRVSMPHERHEFDWMAYQRVVTSEHLVMLYTGQQLFQIVPKRAFASPSEMEAFLRVVQEKIPDRRAGAFPVMSAYATKHEELKDTK